MKLGKSACAFTNKNAMEQLCWHVLKGLLEVENLLDSAACSL